MLERRNIWKRGGLARRVLRMGPKLVYNSAFYGMVIYCIGCVIPTPLDRAPAPTNYQPAFVTSRVSPAFGPTSEPISSGITFALAATDPNPDDVLTVKLFATAPTGGFTPLDITTTLMVPSPPDMDDPNLRLGSIDTALCLRAQPNDKFDIFAFVADRPFTGSTTHADGGLTDSNHWELTCTSM